MKIPLRKLYIDAIFHPKKHAAYRLLSIGRTIQFLFSLVLFITVCAFIKFSFALGDQNDMIEGMSTYMNDIQWLLYPLAFIFLFIINTALLFIRVSFYAAVGLLLLKILSRRGEYRMLWRTASFSITLAFLLTTILSYFLPSSPILTLGGFAVTVLYLFIAIKKYPVQPKAKLNVQAIDKI